MSSAFDLGWGLAVLGAPRREVERDGGECLEGYDAYWRRFDPPDNKLVDKPRRSLYTRLIDCLAGR